MMSQAAMHSTRDLRLRFYGLGFISVLGAAGLGFSILGRLGCRV